MLDDSLLSDLLATTCQNEPGPQGDKHPHIANEGPDWPEPESPAYGLLVHGYTYLVTSFFDLEPEFLTETVTNCNLEAVQVEHGQCHRCPPTVVHFFVNKHFLS